MSTSFYEKQFFYSIFFFPLIMILIAGLFFSLKNYIYGLSSIIGGLSIWIPNMFINFFLWKKKFFSTKWIFILYELIKIIFTIIFTVTLIYLNKFILIPFFSTWFLIIFIQIFFIFWV